MRLLCCRRWEGLLADQTLPIKMGVNIFSWLFLLFIKILGYDMQRVAGNQLLLGLSTVRGGQDMGPTRYSLRRERQTEAAAELPSAPTRHVMGAAHATLGVLTGPQPNAQGPLARLLCWAQAIQVRGHSRPIAKDGQVALQASLTGSRRYPWGMLT
ncbi:putative ribosome-binding factor A, mitochondrial [Platysternon megacephalum]|uniref:Putative ribosome-binding factor A, mitochondrial n=1 Tax=Platysternon megacephalum TaxID=55544 RepID=A0A4D9DZZ6_9SAUR|nr:putative ribosome-binding factor A, mitochondrial [Platysternon megacephalum]